MAKPEELREFQSIETGGLIVPNKPKVNWTDLPIPSHKGNNPHFNLEEILMHEDKTLRVDCQFETIQQVLEHERGFKIPKALADNFAQLQKWQFVVPTHVDVSQLLFLGRQKDDRDSILIDDALATIYFHRGADGGDDLDGGEYGITWVELATIISDSNEDHRAVGIEYNWWGADTNEAAVARINVSFAETEYQRTPTPMDSFLPSTVDICDHSWGIYHTTALMTRSMVESLPNSHKRAVSLHTNPKGGITLHQIGGRDKGPLDIDQSLTLSIKDETIEVGLLKRSDGKNPWTVTIPRKLEHILPR